jgi:hypothetical protein
MLKQLVKINNDLIYNKNLLIRFALKRVLKVSWTLPITALYYCESCPSFYLRLYEYLVPEFQSAISTPQ